MSYTITPHRREDYITKVTRVSPAPGPKPAFDRFMGDITLGDADLIAYHQRSLGACLSGAINDHWLLFWIGEGRNGKNTLGDLIEWILGDYAKTVPVETLMSSKNERHPTDLANLRGVRLAISSEVPEGAYWDESRIKRLTGDATISARYMRQDFFEFPRTHKHLIYGNHRPQLRVVDDAIRARMHVVPFRATFTGDRCDPRMGEKLKAEGPQVLHWLIEGHAQWMADGQKLRKCPAVERETADYFDSQSTPDAWLRECCIGDRRSPEGLGLTLWRGDVEARAGALYRSFTAWKEARGEGVMNQTRWGDWMAARFRKRKSGGLIVYEGVRPKTETEIGAELENSDERAAIQGEERTPYWER